LTKKPLVGGEVGDFVLATFFKFFLQNHQPIPKLELANANGGYVM